MQLPPFFLFHSFGVYFVTKGASDDDGLNEYIEMNFFPSPCLLYLFSHYKKVLVFIYIVSFFRLFLLLLLIQVI